MWIGHRKEIWKLMFRTLALYQREWLRADTRNLHFRISLRWPIHIINPVDKTKLQNSPKKARALIGLKSCLYNPMET